MRSLRRKRDSGRTEPGAGRLGPRARAQARLGGEARAPNGPTVRATLKAWASEAVPHCVRARARRRGSLAGRGAARSGRQRLCGLCL